MSFLTKLKNRGATPTQRLLNGLSTRLAQTGTLFSGGSAGLYFSAENLNESQNAELEGDVEALERAVTDTVEEVASDAPEVEGGEYTEAQIEAAVGAGMAASGRREFLRRASADLPAAGENTTVVAADGALGGDANVGRIEAAVEAYDETENKNTLMHSVTYNLRAARQDEFGETIFPTVTLAPDQATVTISVDLLNIGQDYKRKLGNAYQRQFGARNVIRGLIDPDIFADDTTEVIPVYRSGDTKSTANFVDQSDLAPTTRVRKGNGEKVPTSALKMGKRIELIELSASDAMLAGGVLNRTDQLDTSVALETLYMKVGSEIIAFRNLDMTNEATFTYAVQGNNREMRLNFDVDRIAVDKNTKQHNGSESTHLATIRTTDLSVRLHFNVSGNVNLNTGHITLNAADVAVVKVYDAQGHEQALDQGTGQTTAQLFNDAKLIGYTVKARLINSNRRERGQLLDLTRERMVYAMPILSPISFLRPVTEGDTSDAARLDSLVTATYVRCSNAAVATLHRAEEYLKALPKNHDESDLYGQYVLGAARYFVTPHFREINLDVVQELNTLKSSDRMMDVQAVLVNTIREVAYRAHLESGYKAAADALHGPNSKKPVVIVATDPYIAAYLMVQGDFRTLGNEFEMKVVSTPNIKQRGKIHIVFGKASGAAEDISNPLHFGNMYWRPELATVLPISRENTISKELTVQPSYLHVVHCPIMGVINITNLDKAVAKMAPVFTRAA